MKTDPLSVKSHKTSVLWKATGIAPTCRCLTCPRPFMLPFIAIPVRYAPFIPVVVMICPTCPYHPSSLCSWYAHSYACSVLPKLPVPVLSTLPVLFISPTCPKVFLTYMLCHFCLSLPVLVLPVLCPLAPVSQSRTCPATLWSVSMRRTCHVISVCPSKSLSCLSSVPLLLSPSLVPVRPHCGLSQWGVHVLSFLFFLVSPCPACPLSPCSCLSSLLPVRPHCGLSQ